VLSVHLYVRLSIYHNQKGEKLLSLNFISFPGSSVILFSEQNGVSKFRHDQPQLGHNTVGDEIIS